MKSSSSNGLWFFCVVNFIALIVFGVLFFSKSKNDIVYVDSARLINGYKGTENARKSLEQRLFAWRANVDTLASELQSAISKFEGSSKQLGAKAIEQEKNVIRSKQQALDEYRRNVELRTQQEEAAVTKTLLTEINAYLGKYGEAKGYSIIVAATEYGNVAFASPELDVTDDVLKGLNSEYISK